MEGTATGLGFTGGTTGNPRPTVRTGRAAQPLQPAPAEGARLALGNTQELGHGTWCRSCAQPDRDTAARRRKGGERFEQTDRQTFCGVLWYISDHFCTAGSAPGTDLGAVSRLHCRQRGQHKGCDLSIKVNTVPFTQSIL